MVLANKREWILSLLEQIKEEEDLDQVLKMIESIADKSPAEEMTPAERAAIEKARQSIANGQTLSQQEVNDRLKRWSR